MFGLNSIKSINSWAKSEKCRQLARALNNPSGHAKDAEKGRSRKATAKVTAKAKAKAKK